MRRVTRYAAAIAVGFAVMGAVPGTARAAGGKMCPICEQANSDQATYPQKAGASLVRGASNTLLGWTELIRQPANEVKGGGNVFVGLGKGVVEGVKRTVGGAADILTFWTPKTKTGYIRFTHDCPICEGKAQK